MPGWAVPAQSTPILFGPVFPKLHGSTAFRCRDIQHGDGADHGESENSGRRSEEVSGECSAAAAAAGKAVE